MKRFLLAIVIIFCSSTWAATDKPLCEADMLPNAQRVVRLVTMGLESRDLQASDVKFMLGDADRILNPFLRKNRSEKNLTYRQKLLRELPKLTPHDSEQIRTALLNLIGQNLQRQTQVADAREATNFIFTHKDMRIEQISINPNDANLPFWQMSPEGRPELVAVDVARAAYRVFDPRQRSPLIDRVVLPLGRRIDPKVHMELGHVLTLSDRRGGTVMAIDIHDVESNSSGKIHNVSNLTKEIHLVRNANKDRFVVARTSHGIKIYSVDANLNLYDYCGYEFPSSSMEVLNTPNGLSLIVAVGDDNRTIFIVDPTSREIPRKVRTNWSIKGAKSILLENGDYAIAFQTEEPGESGTRKRLEFITSPNINGKVVHSQDITSEARHGGWYVTQSGRAIYSVRMNLESVGHIDLYEPLTTKPAAKKGLWSRLTRAHDILPPTQTLHSGRLSGTPSFFEFPDGRLLVLIGGTSEDETFIKIFEPAVKDDEIHRLPITRGSYVRSVKMFYVESMNDFIFTAERTAHSEVYAGWKYANLILSLNDAKFGNPAIDTDGHVYLPARVKDSSSPSIGSLELFRLTAAGVGEP